MTAWENFNRIIRGYAQNISQHAEEQTGFLVLTSRALW